MRSLVHVCRAAGLCLAVLATISPASAQKPVAPKPRSGEGGWVVPRMADGHPDLQGTWENNSATPLERPAVFANKPLLTDAELADMKARAARLFAPDSDAAFGDGFYFALLADRNTAPFGTGSYSANWLPNRLIERRTSLITDPPNGKLPPLTETAVRVRAAALVARPRFARGPEDMAVTDRCISYGVPDLFAAYMSVYRIAQTPGAVAIAMEKIHDTRIIPLDGRPHISQKIRHYMGDPRGHWEGDTLVVETTNFHPSGNPMGGLFRFADENLKLTERFTRTAADAMTYEFTVDDPTIWTRPWTAMVPWTKATGSIYEYACHEGNYSIANMLSAARADERAAEQADR